MEIQSKLLGIQIGGKDNPLWLSKKGTFSCAETWDKLRVKLPEVSWWKLVWFSLAIPKHFFLCWLACRDALVTKQKMVCWGYTGDVNRLFCHGGMESRDHLFFSYSFSKRI